MTTILMILVMINKFLFLQTSVVLFTSTNCAFCSLMSHSLLTSSRILDTMNIDFLRLDGDQNDLYW